MQENHRAHLGFVQTTLPWVVAAGAFLLYALTLSHWVTLESLPFVSKVTGWDWTLPYQTPVFFLVTYPFRWLPMTWQPIALNVLSAVCSALTLALLARSVSLLPHDRTHEQRVRERSEFSLLSGRGAWIPPILAALVCGLELTFWEHSTAATNEALDLLIFAYVIRNLLEFRLTQEESWLTRMSFVYGLGVTNNFAMIGFFPCVLIAVLWIKGLSFFEFRFFVRMLGWGLLGLMLYLLLPLAWAFSDSTTVSFWQALRAHWAGQKAMLFHAPQLRTRVVILSLTSILPLLIMGIRWPAAFGDTSAAGAALSSFMFRIVHTAFLAACIWVAFDQQFSPRAFALGIVPFLSFYYLGALGVGYFSGYLLLVFGEARAKARHRPSGLQLLFNRLVVAAVWLTLLGVPVALVAKNWPSIRATNGPLLAELGDLSLQPLPGQGSIVLSDDPYSLLLLSASLSRQGQPNKHVLVHTRSLIGPDYHRELNHRYPNQWPNLFTNQPPDEIIDDASLLLLVRSLSRSNSLYYLHPSFGYYFEAFYLQPHGLVYQLTPYPTNTVFPPALTSGQIQTNQSFWAKLEDPLKVLAAKSKLDSRNAQYARTYYSRALNEWAVALQRNNRDMASDAGKYFQLAVTLNTNNVPAQSNLEFNRALLSGGSRIPETQKSIEEKFGIYRGWERMLLENGPFDQPEICARLGQIFGQQGLFRQAAIQWDRVRSLDPTNLFASVALGDVYLNARMPARTLDEIDRLRTDQKIDSLPADLELELARQEATAQFNLGKTAEAEKIIQAAWAKYPKHPEILDTLVQIYAQSDRLPDALTWSEKIIAANPNQAQPYLNQAQLLQSHQQTAKALDTLDRILQKFPSEPQALLFKAFILLENKDYQKARTELDRLLNLQPENPEALLYKGVVAMETKAYQEAVEPLSDVLKLHPNDVSALRNRALAYLQLGKLAKAEKDYDTIRRLGLRDYAFVGYYGLGEIAYLRKDRDTALKYYNLYLQYAPQRDTPELKQEKELVTARLQELKVAKR